MRNRLLTLGPLRASETRLPPVRDLGERGPGRPRRSFWRSVRCACRGLRDAWSSQRNLRTHVYIALGVIGLGTLLSLSPAEWLWLSFAMGLVIFAELMNTAIEQTVDLVVGLRPDPLARRVKDLAAGSVLFAAAVACLIGFLTLGPRLLPG